MQNEISKIIHDCRKHSGLSQKKLADLAGVGKTSVFDIEKGKVTMQLDTVFKILEVLNIQIKVETPFIEKNNREK